MMVKILVFGDSIAWGAFDLEKGGWVERLKIYFFKNNKDVFVQNLAVSSNDTKGIKSFLENDIKKINEIEPDEYVFLFLIGGNDCRYIEKKENKIISIGEFEKNLKKIIEISEQYSNKIMFIGLTNVDESKTTPFLGSTTKSEFYENKDIKEYNKLIQEVCKENNIHFIPLLDLLSKEDLYDGLHPNSEGHRKIFEKIKPELNKILEKNV